MGKEGQMAQDEPLIGVDELAAKIGKTPQVVRQLARQGAIPFYGVPKRRTHRMFKLSEVLAAMKQGGSEAKAA